MLNNKLIDKYKVMEKCLKDDTRSIKKIKKVGFKLIKKIELINNEMENLNLNRKNNKFLNKEDEQKYIILYQLRDYYDAEFNIIKFILNKTDDLIGNRFLKNKIKNHNFNKFLIDVNKENN